jgi:serine/threonine protein phosphatase 1
VPERFIVIGDIHGCLDALDTLLERVGFGAGDRLVPLGDLVDKGPHGPEVVARLRGLVEAGHDVVPVRGNHDDRMLRWLAHARSGRNPMVDADGELTAQAARLTPEDEAFLRGSVLHHALPGTGFLAVHAGIPPSLRRLPPVDVDGASSRIRKQAGVVMRVRRVDEAGHMVRLAATRPEHPFWADRYDGRFGHVLFGHRAWDRPGPARFAHATGLDLGAVHGNRLAAALVPAGARDAEELDVVMVEQPIPHHPWGPPPV